MKILYLAQCGHPDPRWVASDGERDLAGARGDVPSDLLAGWAVGQGWPELVVILPGAHRTMTAALRSRLSDNLRCISELVRLATDRIAPWHAGIWDGPVGGWSVPLKEEDGMSEIGGRGLPRDAVRVPAETPQLSVDVFVQVWSCLASYGMADSLGSREFCRCLDAWLDAGRPCFVRAFVATWFSAEGGATAPQGKVADHTKGEERHGDKA